MSVIKFNRNFETLFNWDTDLNPTTEQNYQSAVQNWTETEMNIVDTLLWQPETEYEVGNIVKTPSLPSQYVLLCTADGVSGTEEPSYDNVQLNDSVNDGTAVWRISQIAVGAIPLMDNLANADASNVGINSEIDNSEMWGEAIGGGVVEENEQRLVTGGTVYTALDSVQTTISGHRTDIDNNTVAIEKNAEDIATNGENIESNTTNIASLKQDNINLVNTIVELAEMIPDTETFIVNLYVDKITMGIMTIDDVLTRWQESVREALENV